MPDLSCLTSLRSLNQAVTEDNLRPLKLDQPRLSCLKPAAVLLPIIVREQGATLLLTRRASHLKKHGGQISFPGGQVDETDHSLVDTALRETFEETGITGAFLKPLGFLKPCKTSSGFCVFPLVAALEEGFVLKPDPNEVAEIFEVPLSFLMSPDNHHKTTLQWHGHSREVYDMPYQMPDGAFYKIWGVSAQIIMALYEIYQKDAPKYATKRH